MASPHVDSHHKGKEPARDFDDDHLPYYEGEKGWISREWPPQMPKLPRSSPHNTEGGWVFADHWPASPAALDRQGIPHTEGPEGWVAEDLPGQTPPEAGGAGRKTGGVKEATKKSSRVRYHAGRKGWVAPEWNPPYQEGVSRHKEKQRGIIPSAQQHPEMGGFSPAISVAEGGHTIVVEVELPGVPENSIAVEVVHEVCTSVPIYLGNKQQEVSPSRAIALPESHRKAAYLQIRGMKPNRWHSHKVYDERHYGLFMREVFIGYNLPRDVPIQAKYQDGVLVVCVHTVALHPPRKMLKDDVMMHNIADEESAIIEEANE